MITEEKEIICISLFLKGSITYLQDIVGGLEKK